MIRDGMIRGESNASTITKGIVELATNAEVVAGTDTERAVTPAGVSAAIAAIPDPLLYKGVIDCSGSPNYPAADAGHVYVVSVAGKIGGASGPVVAANDMLMCKVDSTASGTHAAVGANWDILEKNAVQASTTEQGLVELATDAETVTGTDTERATTPANLTAKMSTPGTIGDTTAGNIYGKVPIVTHSQTEAALAVNMYGCLHRITGAYTLTLPAAVIGMSAVIRSTSAAAFSVDCNGSDHFELFDGTVLADGNKITSSGAKNESVTIICEVANTWIIVGQSGAFSDGGA